MFVVSNNVITRAWFLPKISLAEQNLAKLFLLDSPVPELIFENIQRASGYIYEFLLLFLAGSWLFLLSTNTVTPIVISKQEELTEFLPSVAILRPLKGLDASLELNLESTYLLDYPYYEICFSLEFDSDPALDVVKKLQLKYPNVKTRVIIGCENVGINPKINNLIQGYKETTSELVWILDSNIMVTPATLRNSVALLKDDNIGLVHHVPIAHQLESVGSFMEGVFLSCTHLKLYSFINWLHISCVIGKSNLYKRRDLDALGGLQQFGNIMAEDSVIGYRLRSLGKDDIIGQDFVYQSLGNISFSDFIFRRARWIRLRKFSQPLVPMYECITESLPCGILGALSFNHYFGWSIKYFFCVHMIIWFLADMFVGYIAYRKFPLNYVESIKLICSWVVREIVAVPVHLWAISGKYIRWRGKVYKLLYDGTGTIIKSDN